MEKIESLINLIPDEIDAFIVTDFLNRRYLTNFSSTAGVVLGTREKVYLLVDFRYFEMAQNLVKNVEVVLFTDLFKTIEEIFKRHSVKNVILETQNVSVKQFEEFKLKLSKFNFLKDSWLDEKIAVLRSIKTDKEIEKIKKSQEVVDAAFSHILNFISIGKTEIEIAKEINRFILDNAQATSFPTIVVSGKNSSLPHGVPSNKKLEAFDFLTMDFGAILDGYCSDMTRTVCVKSVSNFQKELYSIVLKGQELALNEIKAGLVCKDVDKIVRDFFKEYGYEKEFGHGLGHGVGLQIHEDPYLNRISETVLKENMVVTIEPGIYLNSKMGLRIEDMVVVKDEMILNLTKSSKEIICV